MSVYTDWLLASRPWSFTLSAITVCVGTALAAQAGSFSLALFVPTLLGIVCLHAAANLLNDVYDVANGVDTPEVATAQYRPHPMVEGRIQPATVAKVAAGLFVFGALLAVLVALQAGWVVLLFAGAGVALAVVYTAPPVRLKYRALGEVGVFLVWGPLVVGGAWAVQTGEVALSPMLVSVPFGLLTALVLLANNIRDARHDAQQSIETLGTRLSRGQGVALYIGLLTAAFACIPLLILAGLLDGWSLCIFASLPLAAKLVRDMQGEIPLDADARTAQLDTIFGVLLLASLVPGALL